MLIILVGLYVVPTIVAVIRKVPSTGSAIVINLFQRWSLIVGPSPLTWPPDRSLPDSRS